MSKYQAKLINETNPELKNFARLFDDKFGEQLQKYLNLPNRDLLQDFDFIQIILADEFISNYYQGTEFKDFVAQTGIDIELFLNYSAESKNYYIFHMDVDEKAGVMAASPQMRDLINYMDNIINNKSESPKMVIHGGHDNTLNCVQYFMKSAFQIPIKYIPFSSNVYFELHKENENDYYVEYISDGVSLLKKDYNTFKNIVLATAWSEDQIDEFCYTIERQTNSYEQSFWDNNVVPFIFSCIFFVSTLTFLILFIYYMKKTQNFDPLKSHKDIQELNIISNN